jgi:hypothetical protein
MRKVSCQILARLEQGWASRAQYWNCSTKGPGFQNLGFLQVMCIIGKIFRTRQQNVDYRQDVESHAKNQHDSQKQIGKWMLKISQVSASPVK